MSASRKYILLAEDDSVVAELILHTLATMRPAPHVVHVRDGMEALDFLLERGSFSNREPGNPAVILLDLKMPRMNGLEVLRHVKSDERLRATPIVMLTSSEDERDVRQSYALGANAYVVKPVEFQKLTHILRHVETFWLGINLPPTGQASIASVADLP